MANNILSGTVVLRGVLDGSLHMVHRYQRQKRYQSSGDYNIACVLSTLGGGLHVSGAIGRRRS